MPAKLPPNPVGVAPGSSYWNDWYEKLRTFVDQIMTSVDWNIVTNTPTTLPDYGITTGISTTVDLAKLTGGGANGSITVVDGLITAYTAPT
jgi:hypothetical protein